MSPNEPVVYALTMSGGMLTNFTKDLADLELLHRPCPKANCAAWLLGHLTLSDRGLLARAGFTDFPPLPDEGFSHRFSRDEGCPQAGAFGDLSILIPTFEATRARIVEYVRSLPAAEFHRLLGNPHPRFKTVGEVLAFVPLHTAIHAGQVTIIRRSLGKPPMI